MASFDEVNASFRKRIASVAARHKAAPPDLRRKPAAMRAMAASYKDKFPTQRNRVAVPDPALAPARSLAERTLSRQGELKELKNQNRELESQLRQALSIKSHKESEYKRMSESISNTTATNKKLEDSLMGLRHKRDTWAAVISDQLQDLETCEAKTNEDPDLEAAVSWFNKFLGWQIIVGKEGVKFVFDKIDLQCPEKEYSLCMMIDNDTYNLLQCDPAINDFEELLKDLNLTGDMRKFLKGAREKFQASVNGNLPMSSVACADAPSVTSAPPGTTTVKPTGGDVPSESNSQSKNRRPPAKRRGMAPSPGSTRRSPRLEGLHQRGT